jgi:hypothetical protein
MKDFNNMATNNALSNFMEHKFLDQFVAPTVGTIYVAVPFTGQTTGVDGHTIENGLVTADGKFTHVINDTSSVTVGAAGAAKSLSAYPYGVSASETNILAPGNVVAGSFRIVPIFFSFPEGSTNTVQNTYQLDFGVLGDSTGNTNRGVGVSLTGYYVYAGEIRNSAGLVNISSLTDDTIRRAITNCSATEAGYTITVDLTKPAFYGTLSREQAINTGIDILIKENDIKFSMD